MYDTCEIMAERLHFQLPDQLLEQLEEVQRDTGLNKSEIMRRGLLRQLKKLGDV